MMACSSGSSSAMQTPSSLSSREASSLRGLSLLPALKPRARSQPSASPSTVKVMAMAPKNKVNAYDADWNKQWFGAGIFAENTETAPVNIFQKLEKKKLLSQVEKAGLLSKAESAGLTLSSIEKMGLLSKAEDLGLLSLAENFASSSPALLASLALPLIVGAIVSLVVVPDDTTALVVAQTAFSGLLVAGAGALFIASIILSGLQED
ncbi:hypothetical protein KP509_25G059600 [Ceratopteris richardii]|uniref:Uncharacterized protein n=1 Tax=Ceratopteris richardii TaxID=49495 RepID=A0A8T2RQS2_CERRI|nr:hypothetical protein KP509_25G059600 [Ceratopteris richardii]